jgi:hypothetical protein
MYNSAIGANEGMGTRSFTLRRLCRRDESLLLFIPLLFCLLLVRTGPPMVLPQASVWSVIGCIPTDEEEDVIAAAF